MKIISSDEAFEILNTWKMEGAALQAQFAVSQVGHCFMDGKIDVVVPHLLSFKGENCSLNLELPAFLEVAQHDAEDLVVDPSGPGQVAMCALEFSTSDGVRCFIYKLTSLGSGGKGIN